MKPITNNKARKLTNTMPYFITQTKPYPVLLDKIGNTQKELGEIEGILLSEKIISPSERTKLAIYETPLEEFIKKIQHGVEVYLLDEIKKTDEIVLFKENHLRTRFYEYETAREEKRKINEFSGMLFGPRNIYEVLHNIELENKSQKRRINYFITKTMTTKIYF